MKLSHLPLTLGIPKGEARMLPSELEVLRFQRTSQIKRGLPGAQAGVSNLCLGRPLLASLGRAPLLRSPPPALQAPSHHVRLLPL